MVYKIDEYVSVDIEALGPIPGEYSMASIGACLVNDFNKRFYKELQPINDEYDINAVKICGFDVDYLKKNGTDPKNTMLSFASWLKANTDNPIFVGFNAPFDWQFINYYFIKYLEHNPFGTSGIDIKAYFMGMSGTRWYNTHKKNLPKIFQSDRPHTHNALDDALEQSHIFSKILRHNQNRIRNGYGKTIL